MNNCLCVCTKSNVPNSVENDGKRKKLKAKSKELVIWVYIKCYTTALCDLVEILFVFLCIHKKGNFLNTHLDSIVDSKARMKPSFFGVFAVMILLAMVFVHVDCRHLRSRVETLPTVGTGRVEKVTKGDTSGLVSFNGHRKGSWAFKHASGPSMRGPGH